METAKPGKKSEKGPGYVEWYRESKGL